MINFSIATNYTDTPGARYKSEGNFSGEDFRDNYLIPRINQAKAENTKVEINFDGGFGYPTSFLEEAFGGLVRKTKDKDILSYLTFISNEEPALVNEVIQYIKKAIEGLK